MAFEGGCTSNNVSIKVLSAAKRDSIDKCLHLLLGTNINHTYTISILNNIEMIFISNMLFVLMCDMRKLLKKFFISTSEATKLTRLF